VAEHVILFTGPMGAGKTTAIKALSEIEVVSTEANNSERHVVDKPTTTVALDYGEIVIGNDEKIRMYGIPGQRRFDFMWAILKQRAEGMVLLVNNDLADPIAEMLAFMDDFRELCDHGGVVVGISRSDLAPEPTTSDYARALEEVYPELTVPIFTVDPRDPNHMQMALLTLIINLEMRATFGQAGVQQV
jgi:signal recognition particle receptor subunit beta